MAGDNFTNEWHAKRTNQRDGRRRPTEWQRDRERESESHSAYSWNIIIIFDSCLSCGSVLLQVIFVHRRFLSLILCAPLIAHPISTTHHSRHCIASDSEPISFLFQRRRRRRRIIMMKWFFFVCRLTATWVHWLPSHSVLFFSSSFCFIFACTCGRQPDRDGDPTREWKRWRLCDTYFASHDFSLEKMLIAPQLLLHTIHIRMREGYTRLLRHFSYKLINWGIGGSGNWAEAAAAAAIATTRETKEKRQEQSAR